MVVKRALASELHKGSFRLRSQRSGVRATPGALYHNDLQGFSNRSLTLATGLDTMKLTGKVVETLVVEKEVVVEVPDNSSDDTIEQAIRDKAYEQTILDGTHGWEGIETQDVRVSWVMITNA